MAKPRVYRHDALCPKCGLNWAKKDGHSRGKQQYKCNQRRRKRQEGAKHRFADEQKEQSVKICAEGMSLSAAARVMGASIPTVSELVKKRGIGDRASIAAFDEMCTYLEVRRGEGLRSKLRSKLSRLVRRAKGCTKSVDMLKHLPSIALEERLNQSLKSISAAH